MSLSVSQLHPVPAVQFIRWYEQALAAGCDEPNAMTLATVGDNNRPSARIVLLKGADAEGFQFFTNYHSRKGRELAVNPSAALLFYWQTLERQVRIEGLIKQLDVHLSDAYFAERPVEARAAANASPQSAVIDDKEKLLADFKRVIASPELLSARPAYWGGYILVPDAFEFWQGGEHRLHDRFRYRLDNGRWAIERLAP